MRWVFAVLCAFKLAIRAMRRGGALLDLGDMLLMVLLLAFKPYGKDMSFDAAFFLPATGHAVQATICLAGLFLFGRALSGLLGMDSIENLKRVSPGGASTSMKNMARGEAVVAAVFFCIPAAALEEIMFRWILPEALMGFVGEAASNLMQATAFAAVHAIPAAIIGHGRHITIYAAVFPFVSALLLRYMIVEGWGMIPPIMVHSMLNTIAVWRWKFRRVEGIM